MKKIYHPLFLMVPLAALWCSYLWGAGICGDVGHRATGTQFMKTDFSDIVRNLDVALMGMGEARKGPYSLLVDLMFIDTTTRNSLPAGAPASRLKVDNRTVSGFLGGGYTLLEGEKGRLDATAGIRGWYSSSSLNFQGGNADGMGGSDRATWADGVAGLRGHYALTPSIWVSAWGLAGGGQSRLDWDAAALVEAEQSEHLRHYFKQRLEHYRRISQQLPQDQTCG